MYTTVAGSQQEADQATWLTDVENGTAAAGLGSAGVWDLYDWPQNCSNPNANFFGLYRGDGSAKPSAAAVSQAFASAGG